MYIIIFMIIYYHIWLKKTKPLKPCTSEFVYVEKFIAEGLGQCVGLMVVISCVEVEKGDFSQFIL